MSSLAANTPSQDATQSYRRYAPIVLTFLFLFSGNARSQVVTADLVGTVTDTSGAIVSGAKVSILSAETQLTRTTTSGPSGDYVFNLLPPGTYTVRVENAGFKLSETGGVKLGAGDRIRVDVKLEVGQVSETVEVTGEAAPALQTDSSTVQDVVTERAVQDLPLNGRNLVGAIQVTAGVNQGSPAAISSGNRPDDRRPSFTVVANGQSDMANNQMVDGLDNNEREQGFSGVRPSIDAIAEVRVLTNNYSAELGRTAGAVINIVTRSGSNNFHGSAFEYFRNDIFDAKDFFALTKPEYRQNQFGGSLGGPIVKNKTFFFWDIEESRTVQGITRTTTVPTLFEEQNPGNFSDIGGPVVPAGKLSPVSLNFFKLYAAPNKTGTVNNYVSNQNKTQYGTTTDGRVDHQFNDRNSIFVRYGYNPVSTYIPGVLPPVSIFGTTVSPGGILGNFAGPSKTVATNIQANYVHIFRPDLLLELKTGYTRINIHTYPLNYGTNLDSKFGVINGNIGPDSSALSPMWFLAGDYATVGDGIFVPIFDVNNTFQYNGAITYTRGRHNIKTGAALNRRQLNYFQDQFSPQGGFIFTPGGPYGNSMANFLSGSASFAERGADLVFQGLRSWEPSIYVQDDWRAKTWLTLNLGLRWEAFTPITDAHNAYGNFDLSTLKVLTAGVNTSSSGGVKTDYKNFSPRIGFAATLRHGMVLRGGFGMSYYPAQMQTQIQNSNPPFSYICFPCFSTTYPVLPVPAATSTTNPAGTVSALDPNFRAGYVEQFNLFLQKLVGNNVFSVGGVGDLGRRGLYLRNADQPDPAGPGRPQPPYLYAAQLPLVTNIQKVDNSGTANYYAMQLSFIRRTSRGLTVNANYTWAHGLSNSIQSASATTNSYALITSNPHYDYGNSPLDVRHRFALSINYELPFGKSLTGIAAQALRGWQINSIAFWQTGLPFTIVNNSPRINLPGVSSDRPNQIASASLPNPSLTEFFNTSAFAPQILGTAGSETSDAVYGPHARSVNLSLLKDFPIHESLRLQFRAECFNISNTPNFANPGNSLGTPSFGAISSTAANATPRQYQFALKLLF